MQETLQITAREAVERLLAGNQKYIDAKCGIGDISKEIRQRTSQHGQAPYAIIVTCSDSRVIPENIFSAGIGELFVIRLAGNVIDDHQLGSIEYAAGHLGCRLILVMGHTHCGAVEAAMNGNPKNYIKFITFVLPSAMRPMLQRHASSMWHTAFTSSRTAWRSTT